ncbi:MAG: fused MFS/spermidine synthase [Deltaproteobacteria bacterium]|nr:fused MFS/spermidine synthase [Deltaproteobacteria bacterium]
MRSRIMLPVLVSAAIAVIAAARGPGLVYEGDSPYNHLIVEEDAKGVRKLLFEKNGAVQSAIKPGEPLALELPYTRAAMLALALVPSPKKVLNIGLGGGAMPMFLRKLHPETVIEVVELDPGVVKVAKGYFGFKEDSRMKVHVADGRGWTEAASGGWDLVFLDAYGKGEIPRHLATLEFLRCVRAKLAKGGLVDGIVWEPVSIPLDAEMVRTYREAFIDLCVTMVPSSGNRIFFAGRVMPVVDQWVASAAELSARSKLPFELSMYARAGCLREDDVEAPLLRDLPTPQVPAPHVPEGQVPAEPPPP